MTKIVPTQNMHVSEVVMNMTVGEFALTFGRNAYTVHDDQQGCAPTFKDIEWVVTATMAPQIALCLHTILGNMLMDYQEKFGKIPFDPDYVRRFSEAVQSASSAPERPQ